MASGERPSPEEIVLYDKDPETKIATITFNRPEHLNAPTSAARLRYADLLRACDGRRRRQGGGDPRRRRQFRQRRGPARLHGGRRGATGWPSSGCDEAPTSRYPPEGSFRHGATMGQWYANAAAGNRALQELKKISIVEAKGYCYGWHFYQCADADLVISSDDALFGHPSFRYYGWGPRMWTWVLTMGLRPFQEMVFTGRPFTAAEMLACNFLNKVVARDQLEAEVEKYALACARNRPVDTVFQQKVFFEVVKQFQGEYMGSLLSAMFESMGSTVRPDDRRLHARRRDRRGARRFRQRQRREVPARVPVEQVEPREEG